MNHPTPKGFFSSLTKRLGFADEHFIDEWTELIKNPVKRDEFVKSVVIFRLSNHYYALQTAVIVEISDLKKFHKIPHLNRPPFLGTVSFQGELWLGIDLAVFFQLSEHDAGQLKSLMIAIQKDQKRWIFPVDGVYGVHLLDQQSMDKGFVWKDKQVTYLDSTKLFMDLEEVFSDKN